MTYTVIELAVLRTRSVLDAAQELNSLPRADLGLICIMLGIRTKRHCTISDLAYEILQRTHPRQAQAAPATGESSAQLAMF